MSSYNDSISDSEKVSQIKTVVVLTTGRDSILYSNCYVHGK